MSLTSFELAMQTVASVVSKYMKKKDGVPVITKDGLEKLMEEQFPDFEKKKICTGAYEFKISMADSRLNMSLGPLESALQINMDIVVRYEARDIVDLVNQDFMELLIMLGVG